MLHMKLWITHPVLRTVRLLRDVLVINLCQYHGRWSPDSLYSNVWVTIVLSTLGNCVPVFPKRRAYLPTLSQCNKNLKNGNLIHMFLQDNSTRFLKLGRRPIMQNELSWDFDLMINAKKNNYSGPIIIDDGYQLYNNYYCHWLQIVST